MNSLEFMILFFDNWLHFFSKINFGNYNSTMVFMKILVRLKSKQNFFIDEFECVVIDFQFNYTFNFVLHILILLHYNLIEK